MTERYLDALTIHLRGYRGLPVPEDLAEEIVLQVEVGAPVDIDRLADELSGDLGNRPRIMRQSITETNWGASGAGAELIVDIPAVLTGLAALPVLWDTISRRILRHGKANVLVPQDQAEQAREWAAQALRIGTDTIKIVALEPVGDGHRVVLTTPRGIFEAEIDNRGVTRMHPR